MVSRTANIENALDIGLHHNVVDMDSLRGGQSLTEAYTNNVRWLEGSPKTKAILYNAQIVKHKTLQQDNP
ncbi:hypothetical protein EDD15DRAFT_2369934 [Pisolithus albus]|nr:hypothetical protein EDD15DRAFT_2369934 [Pisolithus albus]